MKGVFKMHSVIDGLINTIILKLDYVCREIEILRKNTISNDEYEALQKQIEIISIQVAKSSNLRGNRVIFIPQRPTSSNERDTSDN